MAEHDPALAVPVLRALSAAVTTRAMYPPNHPRVSGAVTDLVSALHSCLRIRKSEDITFLTIEHEFLVDDRPLRSQNLRLAPLIRILASHRIERLTLGDGLDEEECHRLVEGLARSDEIESTDHVVFGRVQLGEAGEAPARVDGMPRLRPDEISEDEVDEVEESFLRFRSDRRGSVQQLDQMLWRFVEGMDQSSRSLLLMSPMRSVDQRLFVHSINVALLTVAQARSLGIVGQALHDIGLAAMLHDVGKLSLPRALLRKRERYTDRQFEIIMLHPELGAAQLAGIPEVPHVAVLAAYEHHLRWDGRPSYPIPTVPRNPNLASQMISISDTYDAMVSAHGPAGGVHSLAARKVWRSRSETHLDPFLVGNFVLMISEAE